MVRLRPLFLLVVLLCLAGLAPPPGAQPGSLPLSGPTQDLTPALRYAPGTAETPETMLRRHRDGGFGPELRVDTFGSHYAPELWAAVDLIAEDPITGRISVRVPIVTTLDIYLVRAEEEEEITPILTYSLLEAIVPHEHVGGRLVSLPVTLEAGEAVTLLSHIRFGPVETVDMAFETAEATLARAQADAAWLAAFYAFSFACVLVFVALFAVVEDWLGLFFGVMFLFGLLVIASVDGLLYRLLFPDQSALMRPVSIAVLYGLAASGYMLAAYGFRVGERPRLARAMHVLHACCALSFLLALVWPAPQAFTAAYALLAVMFVGVIFGTRAWEDRRLSALPFSGAIAIVSGGGFALLIAGIAVGWSQQAPDIPTTAKALYLLLMLASLVRFGAYVVLIRRAEAEAQRAERAALTREAVLNRRLLETEKGYSHARDLAEARRRRLASASHDLRQPLVSLRMTVDGLARDLDPESRARLGEAFDYIAGLSGSYLEEAAPETPERAEDPYPLSLIFETVQQMFMQEAEAKGLRLRSVPVDWETDVPPMALMRIVSNLTSNAIRATESGGVLLGARRHGTARRLMVCDTGPGLSSEDLGALRREGAKGETSEGHGIGLATCFSLAESHGLILTAQGRPGRGTCFSLSLPPAGTR